MKIRTAHVSNSSSSSFIISTQDLSKEQIMLINNHGAVARSMGTICDPDDEWQIEKLEGRIECSTWMDNFDLYQFLKDLGLRMKLEEYHDDSTSIH